MEVRETQVAAGRLNLQLHLVPISAENSIENAFEKIKKGAVQALIVVTDPILFSQRNQILGLAAGNRLPAMYPYRGFPEGGGLISYAPNDLDIFRHAASYVDRILKAPTPAICRLNSRPIRACHQSQDRKDARPHHSAHIARGRRWGDRVRDFAAPAQVFASFRRRAAIRSHLA
ncbi:MAG: ABC transporter substrate binding protein [Xanthobacteraceae bacterium]